LANFPFLGETVVESGAILKE